LLLAGDIESNPGPNFTIVHQNVRGLLSKKDDIENFINKNSVKIYGVTETHLNLHTPSCFIEIRGYNCERKDRKNNPGGGVCIYIKNEIHYNRRNDLEQDDIECVWLELFMTKAKSFLVGIVYRPPDNSKYLSKCFEEKFGKTLSKINRQNREALILGDLNCNYLDRSNHKSLKEILKLQGFSQMIKSATRTTEQSETLIDVVLTNHPEKIINSMVVASEISDHDIITCQRKVNNVKHKPKTIKCRNYINYDHNVVREELGNTDWTEFYRQTESNKSWKILKTILLTVLNRNAPMVEKKVKGKNCEWLDQNLKTEMNIRDNFHRKYIKYKKHEDRVNYAKQRNKVNILVRKAKNSYLREKLNENANKPDMFWKIIKETFPFKSKVEIARSFVTDGERTELCR